MAQSHSPSAVLRSAADKELTRTLGGFFAPEKTIQPVLGWDRDGPNLRFEAAVDIEGVTEEGLFLFGRARLSNVDRDVTLGFKWADARNRGGCFERIDWLPMGAHQNKGIGPIELRFVLQECTHIHQFKENAALRMGITKAIRENLPVALPIDPEPGNWASFLTLAASTWNMPSLPGMIPKPEWQLGLVPPTGGEKPPRMKGSKR